MCLFVVLYEPVYETLFTFSLIDRSSAFSTDADSWLLKKMKYELSWFKTGNILVQLSRKMIRSIHHFISMNCIEAGEDPGFLAPAEPPPIGSVTVMYWLYCNVQSTLNQHRVKFPVSAHFFAFFCTVIIFLKKIGGHESFFMAIDTPVWISHGVCAGFQSQSESSHPHALSPWIPQIHLWCDTCWPLGSQHGGWAVFGSWGWDQMCHYLTTCSKTVAVHCHYWFV